MSKNSGTLIINTVRPYDSNDTYPSAQADELLGGHYQVADTTARDAIPSGRRVEGMSCWVVADERTYRLIDGISNANWVADIKITVSNVAPSTPLTGDIWVDTNP